MLYHSIIVSSLLFVKGGVGGFSKTGIRGGMQRVLWNGEGHQKGERVIKRGDGKNYETHTHKTPNKFIY